MGLFPFTREPSLLDKAWMAARYPVDVIASPVRAILSIPALSFLVIPAFSSYSTSVNLLFFYITWNILIRSNDPIHIELYGTLGIRILFYLIPSFSFLAFDTLSPSIAISIKEHGEIALPMGKHRSGGKGGGWKIAFISTGNVLLSVALQIGIELVVTHVLHLRSLLNISTTVPFPWTIAKDILLGLLLREIITYGVHRYALHSGQSRLSEYHQTWQHSHNIQAPYSLIAHYDHPFTYLLHVFVPMYIPATLLRFHLLTYQVYLILISLEEVFAYSGYNVLPSALILGGMARRQERHLMGIGDGNYGCFGLADVLMGSSLGTEFFGDLMDEADEKWITNTAKGKAKGLSGKAKPHKRRQKEGRDDEEILGEDDEEEEDGRRKSKGRNIKAKRSSRSVNKEEDESTGRESKGNVRSPNKRSGPARRNKTNDGVEAGENEELKANGKGVARKGNSKSKSESRSRKLSEEED